MATLKGTLLVLARGPRYFLCQSQRYLSTTTPVAAGYWNKDWKPSPIPRTPEERAAAAKKYGLRPEDYTSLADSEMGDYPHLPIVAKQWRDPFEDYDNPVLRRNYGDPIHADNEHIGSELWDPNTDGRYSFEKSLLFAVLIFAGFASAFLLSQPYKVFLPQMPKQYPFNNLYLEHGGDPALEEETKHYTFEPADSE